jgi:hypothetical protein
MLPSPMRTRDAEAMLLAIAWQESEMRYRRQVPVAHARGYWQFERGGGVRGVLSHPQTARHAQTVCLAFDVAPQDHEVYVAIEHHDVLAACCARLLLWTLPGPLPTQSHRDTAWAQYLAAWRPGKPHERRWSQSWAVAWATLGTERIG